MEVEVSYTHTPVSVLVHQEMCEYHIPLCRAACGEAIIQQCLGGNILAMTNLKLYD